jgi:hypothetical protein
LRHPGARKMGFSVSVELVSAEADLRPAANRDGRAPD